LIKINKEGNTIILKGHSEYEVIGKDIVCSAVSTLVISTINAIKKIGGDIDCEYIEDALTVEYKSDDVTDKLIENMIDMLKELKEQYPENIGGEF
jgi:uncharacterized protein